MTTYEVLVRADGGARVGYGHLFRTNTLVNQFLINGHEVIVATLTPESAADIYPPEVDIVALDSNSERDSLRELLTVSKPDIAVLDYYEMDPNYQRLATNHADVLVVIQDNEKFPICADIVVNGNVHARDLKYDWKGNEPVWCLGPEYLLLREEFRNVEEPPWNREAERALVIMGGSDTRNTTPTVIRTFNGLEVEVDVVIGPGYRNKAEISESIERTTVHVRTHENPDELSEKMKLADLAVSATGTTIYELLATRTPTIGIPQASNQEPIARALADREAILHCPMESLGLLRSKIETLIDDPEMRKELRSSGGSIVDGCGAHRVYRTIIRTLAESGP